MRPTLKLVEVDKYATHVPLLTACAMTAVGDIMEAGVGYYSTPLLQVISRARGVALHSFEEHEEWGVRIQELTEQPVTVTTTIEKELRRLDPVPDVAFFDNGAFRICPLRVRGECMLAALEMGVRLVIAHDTEPARRTKYGFDRVYEAAKYTVSWRGCYGDLEEDLPWTSVFSDTDNLGWLIDRMGGLCHESE